MLTGPYYPAECLHHPLTEDVSRWSIRNSKRTITVINTLRKMSSRAMQLFKNAFPWWIIISASPLGSTSGMCCLSLDISLNTRLTFRLLPLRLGAHHYRCCRFLSRRPRFSPGCVSLRVALGPGLEDPRRQARSGVANNLQMFACIRARQLVMSPPTLPRSSITSHLLPDTSWGRGRGDQILQL